MSKYQALIDALASIPPGEQWNLERGSVWANSVPFQTFVCDALDQTDAAYIAAAAPDTIRSLLADLERAEKALKDARPYLDEALAIHDITYDHHPATKGERCVIAEDLAAIDSALSQLKGVQ